MLDEVGRGGQGEVWRARDIRHDRTVAVKVQRNVLSGERDALLHEVRVLLDIRPHPGLPIVREDLFDGNDYFIVMDWIDGTRSTRSFSDTGRRASRYRRSCRTSASSHPVSITSIDRIRR